ncbi:MAG: TIGR02391 family protein [Deltaproteobacteria bacterium]|nr:MAG: TIGR02391 family protein [Deltaproteobacteria bacterium]
MTTIPFINSNQLEAICKVLADTEKGLTGSEIGHLLEQLGINDPDPSMTKWKRLYNALAAKQNGDRHGASVCQFIQAAMEPVRFSGQIEKYEERRDALNQVIAFLGYSLGDDGKLRKVETAKTLTDAEKRANRLRTELQRRGVHSDVLNVCQARLLRQDYFYTVLEAAKSVAEKIRQKSELTTDGAPLVDGAFGIPKNGYPLIAFNSLQTDSEKSEHRGLANLMKGLFGAFRNPTAHRPEHTWHLSEQDALDLLTIASLIHRRLDNAVRTPGPCKQ